MVEVPGPSNAPAARAVTQLPFQAHVELLELFLANRDAIVARVQEALNAQRMPPQYLQDRDLLSRRFEDCFFALPGVTADRARLRGQLAQAHWARGFKPREIPDMPNDLVDPAEMMARAFHLWASTRWPGNNGRLRFARALFNLYLVRQLALLSVRAWDAGSDGAAGRLAQAQRVLDLVWRNNPEDQPVLVRDVRWLVPVAMSPVTDDLAPYFEVAEEIDAIAANDDRLQILDASVRMAGGHLRSYLHFAVMQHGVPLRDGALTLLTRKSNALDFSLLIHGLVPLLDAYERAIDDGNAEKRRQFADAICQGVSADPELLINRVDLLGAYTMVEHLFTTTDRDGKAVYTPLGQRHVELLDDYAARIGRVAKALHEDCRSFKPADGGYSPYGVLYGYSSNLLEHIVFKAVQRDDVTRFSLEDVFTDGGADKLAWVESWRDLPHVERELRNMYAYPQRFADELFERVEQALRARAENGAGATTGRLFVLSVDDVEADSPAAAIADLPIRYVGSSDAKIVAAGRAEACDQQPLLNARLEGHFAVSYETPGGWVAVTKDFVTEVLGAGRDAKIVGLPTVAAERLRLMCRGLVAR
jgi:hypothetical protein